MDLKDIRDNILAKANWMDSYFGPPAKAGGNLADGNLAGSNSADGNSINRNLMNRNAMNRNAALAHSFKIKSKTPMGFSQNYLLNQLKEVIQQEAIRQMAILSIGIS